MALARATEQSIKDRAEKIKLWKDQIKHWEVMKKDKSIALQKLRDSSTAAVKRKTDDIWKMVRNLEFKTPEGSATLARAVGELDGIELFHYDITDVENRIEGAKQIIAALDEQNRRAKKGELLKA